MIIRDEMRVEKTNIIFGLYGNNTDLQTIRIKLGTVGGEGREQFCGLPVALGLGGEVCAGLFCSGQRKRRTGRVWALPFSTRMWYRTAAAGCPEVVREVSGRGRNPSGTAEETWGYFPPGGLS